ncbi:MAG: CbiX/SirB N-terminal domain-containing protein [Natronomonas sp.]
MSDTLLLVGRKHTRSVTETHAARLRDRDAADRVRVATYDREPAELDAGVGGEDVYVVPMTVAPDRETIQGIPGAFPSANHCEPVGTSPAVTQALTDRAREAIDSDAGIGDTTRDVSVGIVAFGDTSLSEPRGVTEQHADRLRDSGAFDTVATAYLLQNPAAECIRYNLTGDTAVVVPFFIAGCEETDDAIPERIELDRGGITYADPLGTHEAVTDAIESELARARAIGGGTASVRPVATDGRGE